MLESVFLQYSMMSLFVIAFLVNIPLGFIREQCPKFSFAWLFWIHASIPLIIFLRLRYNVPPVSIPFTISFAILGQILGSRYGRSIMPAEKKDALAQIPDLGKRPRQKVLPQKVLVALLNMGGPLTNHNVKAFQERLFADPLLIRFPLSFLLQKFFAWILITVRLNAVKARYMEIGGGSPIYRSTQAQVKALKEELRRRNVDVDVTYSFNYSPPLSEHTVRVAQKLKKEYVMPISLYPHYSKATTGSNLHYLKKAAHQAYPALQFLDAPAYYLHPGYINAFVDRIREEIPGGESLDDYYLLFSAHGLPLYFLVEGDPYPFQIAQTVGAVLAKLSRTVEWAISYQSAVGPLQWIKPSTDDMLKALAKTGVKKILIVPIAFVGDHIETIHEIDIEYRHMAKELGITDFRMSKAIECHPEFISALADVIQSSLHQNKQSDCNSFLKETEVSRV